MTGGAARTAAEIAAVEISMGLNLPTDYRAFLQQHDGARPEDNRFDISKTNSSSVNCFIALEDVSSERRFIENLPATRIPVAWDDSGNYVCLETAPQGGVYFWDHEEPHREHRIADCFGDFLEKLEPDSLDDFELDPSRVKRVWINPDFLAKIKKGK